MRVRFNWWIVFAIFTVHGLLNSTYSYLDHLARAHPVTPLVPFLEQMTGNYGAMLLFPGVAWVVRHYVFRVNQRGLSALVYSIALLVFSAVHTTLNAVSRDLLFPLTGLGDYDYGIMPVRFLMEFPSDVLAFALMVGSVYSIDLYDTSRKREIAAAQLESHLAQAQLQNLRLQLQPHFLFNALNTISSVMYEDARAADEMIARLSEFLRLTLSSSPSQEVRLAEELHFLDLYLNIMRARFENRLQVRLFIDPDLEDALVPQLILQPLVENSIRHGAEPVSGQVAIEVSARRANGTLLLAIRDHGRGLRETREIVLGRGIGLANTAGRLVRLYGVEHQLSFENPADGGLLVSVEIPYRT